MCQEILRTNFKTNVSKSVQRVDILNLGVKNQKSQARRAKAMRPTPAEC